MIDYLINDAIFLAIFFTLCIVAATAVVTVQIVKFRKKR